MDIKLTDHAAGVKASLHGFSADYVGAKIDACQNGQCDCNCDPAIMQKIIGIEMTQDHQGVTITITGDVDTKTLEPMMKECLLGEKK